MISPRRMLFALMFPLLTLAGLTARTATPINETRALDPRGRIEIENVKGVIDVRAWDRDEVRIEGSLGKGAERLEVKGDRGRLEVRVKYPARSGFRLPFGNLSTGSARVEPSVLRLLVPLRADLDISAVSADITVWGVAPASLKIENVSGRTTVAAAPQRLELDSVSGDTDLTINRGDIDAQSVSGDIHLSGRLGDEVALESVSGDVVVRVADTPLRRFEGTTVSGDIDVSTSLAVNARLTMESVSGDIALRLPPHVSAEVRAESFSGHLSAPGATVQRPEHGPGSSLRQRYGDGKAEVSMETFSGDARLLLD